MKKTDKKIDNALREALTQVCESALASIDGFVWLTHLVNYNDFPRSLNIVCVFETDEQLSTAYDKKETDQLCRLIESKLRDIDIKLKQAMKQISFDTEEACERFHGGKWNECLQKFNLH
ncbi:Fis family transcriptional regulator [Marinomonas sp. C1424]|uniref:Fis family transcriptional regulator n=2 Tax=Marinomonas transparens TaxID=2795388 RepID=A0A934N5T9_9GAMM|nr:Fis family transcriptional regulator [Marinomonas transparens]